MYRLGDLTEQQRSRYGWGLMVLGAVGLVLAVIIVHWASFPETHFVNGVEEPFVVDFLNWMPRGWLPKGIGYLIAFGASQLMLVGAGIAFILGKPMTEEFGWDRSVIANGLSIETIMVGSGVRPRNTVWSNSVSDTPKPLTVQ